MVGKDLLIAVGGVIVAAQRSCTLNMDVDTIEVCSPVDGAWKKHIPTTIGWQVQCAGLIYNPEHADALIEAISKREMVRISFYDPELRMLRSGYAIMTTLEEGGSIGDMASQSMQFLGSGELEKVKAVCENMDSYGIEVAGRAISGASDNHDIYGANPNTNSIYIRQVSYGGVIRVNIKCKHTGSAGNIPVILIAKGTDSQVASFCGGVTGNMIDFYTKYEFDHVRGDADEDVVESILIPSGGNYCILWNKTQKQYFEVSYVSIPVN